MIDHQAEILRIEKEKMAYEAMQKDLETDHWGEWVLVHDQELIGLFDTFQKAAAVARRRFGRGPYLIKRIGEGPLTLPPIVMFPGIAFGRHTSFLSRRHTVPAN